MTMSDPWDLKIHVNGEHTFFLHQRYLCAFSGRLRAAVNQERRRRNEIKLSDFPGGANGFELVSRFCYNGGHVVMSPANIAVLNSSAIYLEMTEEISSCNLIMQSETFLDGLFYWTWDDVIVSLKTCQSFFPVADKLITALLGKISANSAAALAAAPYTATPISSSPSSSSSPETYSNMKTPDAVRSCFTKEWWFDDLTILAPSVIEKVMRMLGAFGSDNKNLILTRFLLHYLKCAAAATATNRPAFTGGSQATYSGLADTAVHGVVVMGRSTFSCRGLFWVLRLVSCHGISDECRRMLERLIGIALDQATLDDLLVSSGGSSVIGVGVYDVNLVLRLIRVFVGGETCSGGVPPYKMKKVGRLIDKYLREIAPDHGLKVSKFLEVAESLPDSARDCFDGVYRALDIFLEAHAGLTSDERAKACSCINYEKLTLEVCKDLAKNPRVPPRAAMQALASQQPKIQSAIKDDADDHNHNNNNLNGGHTALERENDEMELKANLQRMQSRVMELEKVCREMKGQMSRMVLKTKSGSNYNARGLPRLC